jgi:hypothetical protein
MKIAVRIAITYINYLFLNLIFNVHIMIDWVARPMYRKIVNLQIIIIFSSVSVQFNVSFSKGTVIQFTFKWLNKLIVNMINNVIRKNRKI